VGEIVWLFQFSGAYGSTSLSEFQERLTEVEEIVLSCLYRQPSETFAEIDAILAEEGANTQPIKSRII